MQGILQLIIQAVSGALGGNAVGKASPKLDLGAIGNTIAGILGGLGGSQLVGLLGVVNSASGSTDIGSIIASILGGGVGGGVLTAIVGLIKNMLNKK